MSQPSHLVAKVDCLSVTGNTALFTARITKATGWYEQNNPVGTELAVSAVDGFPDMWGAPTTTGSCNFIFLPGNTVVQGNIRVSDAP
ncbi:MAG: hypothetical protein ACRDQ2_11230 [Gaiellales bacterium]